MAFMAASFAAKRAAKRSTKLALDSQYRISAAVKMRSVKRFPKR